jgi:hypothetical protein
MVNWKDGKLHFVGAASFSEDRLRDEYTAIDEAKEKLSDLFDVSKDFIKEQSVGATHDGHLGIVVYYEQTFIPLAWIVGIKKDGRDAYLPLPCVSEFGRAMYALADMRLSCRLQIGG